MVFYHIYLKGWICCNCSRWTSWFSDYSNISHIVNLVQLFPSAYFNKYFFQFEVPSDIKKSFNKPKSLSLFWSKPELILRTTSWEPLIYVDRGFSTVLFRKYLAWVVEISITVIYGLWVTNYQWLRTTDQSRYLRIWSCYYSLNSLL